LALHFLLVPLNPNGIRMFRYPIETLRSSAMQEYIAEWASPNFHHAEYWPFLIMILITLTMAGTLGMRLRPRDVVLLIVSLYAGLSSIRMMPIFVFVAAPLISREVGSWPGGETGLRQLQSPAPPWLRPVVNGALVLAMAAFTAGHAYKLIRSQPEAESREFPARAVAYLEKHPATGRIFNDYGWGGYLIWKLYPVPVFIDGRADLYGPLLNQFAATYSFRNDWQKPLQLWKINTVMVPPDSALAAGLKSAPGWTVRYEDAQAILLTSGPVTPGEVDERTGR